MEEGDTFSLTVLDRVLTYEVDQILITEPEEIEPLLIVDGEDYCTLYTCYPYGVNTERLLVRGHRIPTPETEKTAVSVLTEESSRPWLAAAAAAALAAGIAVAMVIKKRKRKETKPEDQFPPEEADRREQTDKEEGNEK